MKKQKKPTKSKLKKVLWKIFSEYIRRRDANLDGYCECVTCDAVKPWKEMQAGHFISGRRNSIIYEESNVHAQCFRCNIFGHGEQLKYRDHIVEKYGEAEVVRLRSLNEKSVKFTIQDYERMIEEFKTKLKELA